MPILLVFLAILLFVAVVSSVFHFLTIIFIPVLVIALLIYIRNNWNRK
ncbi:MAG: hypothetical protein LBM27_05245 [Lactobacillaceae bacterium]|jgi:hypothetical protein|nr:hypothetical protein [Lactobacillaceae bacterium]